MNRLQRPLSVAWLVTLSALLLVFGPRLLTPGTHVDGTTYAIMARNLALGKGSWWHLRYSQPDGYWLGDSSGDFYVDNPLLGIWIEAIFFKIFGDHWWVEEVVTGLWLLLIAVLLVRCWRVIQPDSPARELGWLPVLWLGTGFYARYCLSGNLLELPLLASGTFGFYHLLRALLQGRAAGWYWAGLALFLGVLTKGPFILYLWVAPLLYFLLVDRRRSFAGTVLKPTLLLVGIPTILFGLGLLYEPFRTFWTAFFEQQIVRSLHNTRQNFFNETVDPWGRWFVWKVLLINLAVPLLLLVLSQLQPLRPTAFHRRVGYFLLALGVCGVLPLCLTLRQNPQYVFASMPAWVLGLSIWHAPALQAVLARWPLGLLPYRVLAVGLSLATVLGIHWQIQHRVTGNNPRQNELLQGVRHLRQVPYGSVIATLDARPIRDDWYFNLMLNRCHGVELTLNRARTPYLVAYRTDPRSTLLPRLGYERLELMSDSLYQFWARRPAVGPLPMDREAERASPTVALQAVEVEPIGQRTGIELLRVDAGVEGFVP